MIVICFASCVLAFFISQVPSGTYTIHTVAGTDFVGDGGYATAAILSQPEGIALDFAGDIYIADADDNRVRKITPDGVINTIAGTGVAGFSGDGGPANLAQLSQPYGLAVDTIGDVYIADLGNARVRKITPDGTITTVSGGGTIQPGDGVVASNASLSAPRNVAIGPDGSLYISDFGANQVFRVLPDGTLQLMAGTGIAGFSGDGAFANAAQLRSPAGLAIGSDGVLYIADSGNNAIRAVTRGLISTVAKLSEPTGIATGPGNTTYVAALNYIGTLANKITDAYGGGRDLAVDVSGGIYFTSGPLVIKLGTDSTFKTIAGSGASRYYGGDGGPAQNARLHAPAGIVRDSTGNWYIADSGNNRIRKIDQSGVITTLAGIGDSGSKGDGGPAGLAQFSNPQALALDNHGVLYIADSGNHRIRRISTSGTVTTLVAGLKNPAAVVVDDAGSVYIADTGADEVLKVSPSGAASTAAAVPRPSALAFDANGNLLVASSSRIAQLTADGSLSTLADGLVTVGALALAPNGNVLVAEAASNAVWSMSSTGLLTSLAGTGIAGFAGDDGSAKEAELNGPSGIGIDAAGVIWVADTGNNRIRALVPAPAATVQPSSSISVVNGATLAAGPIAPGEIVTIFGWGFDPATLQVTFDGNPATILASTSTQANVLAPVPLTPSGTSQIQVLVGGISIAQVPATLVDAAPGVFTYSGGSGPAIATNQDGTVNSATNPASPGSPITIYATGLGQTEASIGVTMAGIPAGLYYAAAAPGLPGVTLVTARIPSSISTNGPVAVVAAVGNATSQPGVSIAVH